MTKEKHVNRKWEHKQIMKSKKRSENVYTEWEKRTRMKTNANFITY